MADLSVEFAGVKFKNPVLAASAEPTLTVANMRQCVEAGAGGIVIKSVSNAPTMRMNFHMWHILNERHEPAHGKIPRLFSLYGRGAVSNLILKDWIVVVKEAKKICDDYGAVLVGSTTGPEPESFVEHLKCMEEAGVSIAELNFGCPNPASMKLEHKEGMEIGQDEELAAEIVSRASRAVSIPLVIKLTPQIPDVVHMATRMREAGAKGVTITNRFIGFVVDIETTKPLLYGWAGIGGPWVKPLSLRWVSKIHAAMNDFPISGSNGPYDWKDIVEFMMSGATTVQLGSVLFVKGIDYIGTTVKGLNDFLDRKGYKTAREIIGVSARQAMLYDEIFKQPRNQASIDQELCIACDKCRISCMFRAVEHTDGKYRINKKECAGCQICYGICPANAIYFVPAESGKA